MNDTLAERLQEAEQAERELTRMQTLAAEAPRLREQAEHEQRQAYEAQRLAESKSQAAQAVEAVRPELEAVRAEFQQWAADGWDLVQRLNIAEEPLGQALAQLAGIAAAEGRTRVQGEALAVYVGDNEVDAALSEVGAFDNSLQPLPSGGSEFAKALKQVFAAFTHCYHPGLRGRQFRQGGPV